MKPIVITGCQRSGTAYIAAAFTNSGYWGSHERFFTERKQYPLRPSVIEASWVAAAFLSELDAIIVHQYRDPLKVVASTLARLTFKDQMKESARFAYHHCLPLYRVQRDSEPADRALRYWIEWNTMIEGYAALSWQLEQVCPEGIAAALELSERESDLGRIERGLEILPASINAGDDVPTVSWDDFESIELVERAKELADRYGY